MVESDGVVSRARCTRCPRTVSLCWHSTPRWMAGQRANVGLVVRLYPLGPQHETYPHGLAVVGPLPDTEAHYNRAEPAAFYDAGGALGALKRFGRVVAEAQGLVKPEAVR